MPPRRSRPRSTSPWGWRPPKGKGPRRRRRALVLDLPTLVATTPAELRVAVELGLEQVEPAFRRVAAALAMFEGYWRGEVRYMLNQGRRPPIAAGLSLVLASSEADALLGDKRPEPVPFADSAAALIDDLDALELELLRIELGREEADTLVRADWDALGSEIVATHRAIRDRIGDALKPMTVADAGDAVVAPDAHRPLLSAAKGEDLGADELERAAVFLFSGLVGIALYDAGFELAVLPGEPRAYRRGDLALDPETELRTVAETGDAGAWRDRVRDAGVADLAL